MMANSLSERYARWDHIEISDDSDEEVHPNVDRRSFQKWRREAKEREEEQKKLERQEEDRRREENLKALAALREQLQLAVDERSKLRSDDADAHNGEEIEKKVAALSKEIESRQADEDAIAKKRREEEEADKKFVKWNAKNICHDGFQKTVVNKETPLKKPESLTTSHKETPASAPALAAISKTTPASSEKSTAEATSASSPAPAKEELSEEEKARKEEEQLEEYVRQMEMKAQKFAACSDFDEMLQHLGKNQELLGEETVEYLLLHCSDNIKKGKYDLSKRYLRASQVIQYCMDLGKNGVAMFFARMRGEDATYRKRFNDEVLQYWERIRVKLAELAKEREERKKRGEPTTDDEDEEEEEDEVVEASS